MDARAVMFERRRHLLLDVLPELALVNRVPDAVHEIVIADACTLARTRRSEWHSEYPDEKVPGGAAHQRW